MNNIYVQDNFFDDNFFERLKKEVMTLNFESRYAEHSKLPENDSSNNLYQRNYHHVDLPQDAAVCFEVVKKIKKYFNFSTKRMDSYYFLSFPNTPPIPHDDPTLYNCLIYLIGDKLVANGTGFYEKRKLDDGEDYDLHTHIGFKENRAIFFDGKIWHSPMQFAEPASPRYAMANFIYE